MKKKFVGKCAGSLIGFLVLAFQCSYGKDYNGFDVSNLTLKKSEVLSGGPARDGIPALNQPRFKPISAVDYLQDEDQVISIVRGNEARAYPTRILIWHEVVNDTVSGEPLAITYCPLCGTAMVFSRSVQGRSLSFGVSGLLYRSNLLMYDRQTESLWSQMAMKAVSGPYAGAELGWLASEQLSWQRWREKYPHGVVLSNDTPYQRQYSRRAYRAYFKSPRPMFPVPKKRKELRQKAWVVGVVVNGVAKAYAVISLQDTPDVKDVMGNTELMVKYDLLHKHATITDRSGTPIPSVLVFWFAWQAFYPETELWNP